MEALRGVIFVLRKVRNPKSALRRQSFPIVLITHSASEDAVDPQGMNDKFCTLNVKTPQVLCPHHRSLSAVGPETPETVRGLPWSDSATGSVVRVALSAAFSL